MPNDTMGAIAGGAANALLVIRDVTYNVLDGPPEKSAFVALARQEVMQNLDLGRMLTDLDRTNDLLYVASCGVAGYGKGLSASISRLQYKLLTSCSDAMSAMFTFKEAAENVLTALRRAFRELYNLREDRCIAILGRCEQYALTMAETAGSLADGFKALADGAQAVLEATLTTRDAQEQGREAALKRKAEIETSDAKAKTLRAALAEQMEKVQKLYNEAKEAQGKAEDRAFALAIVGNITSAIGSGVAAFAAVKAAPLTAASNLASSVAESLKPPAAWGAETRKNDAPVAAEGEEDEEEEDEAAEEDEDETPATEGENESEISDDEADEDDASAGGGTSTGGAAPKDAAAIAAAVAASTAEISRGSQQMAGSYDAIAARYAQEKGKYLDLLMDLQRQQREALGAIAEYAERMRTAGKEAVLAEAAVRSLQQAVAALKQIVTILETAKLFWEMMARACKGLANGRLREDIKLYMEDPKEERAAEWSRPEFKTQMLSLAAKWLALRLIAGDYQSAVAATRERVKETINRAPTIEEARILAPKLGEKLALDVKKDLEALDQANAELQQQRQQLAAA